MAILVSEPPEKVLGTFTLVVEFQCIPLSTDIARFPSGPIESCVSKTTPSLGFVAVILNPD